MGNKANKMFSLDNSIIAQFENVPNASKLVNDLLIEYFNQNNTNEKGGEDFSINEDMSVKEKLGVLKKKQKFEKIKKKNEERIKKINLHPLIKDWFLKLNIKPKYLELVDFMKYNEIPLSDYDVLSIWKEWENVKASSPNF